MKSIIAALLFGALAIVATPTTASAKVKTGKTYNWVYQIATLNSKSSEIVKYRGTYILKSACEAQAKKMEKAQEKKLSGLWRNTYVCIRKQP